MIGEDIASKTATLFSPAFLRQEFFPRLRTLIGMYHDLGFKVIFHSDGNLNAVMDDLVAAEIDGINPIERKPAWTFRPDQGALWQAAGDRGRHRCQRASCRWVSRMRCERPHARRCVSPLPAPATCWAPPPS